LVRSGGKRDAGTAVGGENYVLLRKGGIEKKGKAFGRLVSPFQKKPGKSSAKRRESISVSHGRKKHHHREKGRCWEKGLACGKKAKNERERHKRGHGRSLAGKNGTAETSGVGCPRACHESAKKVVRKTLCVGKEKAGKRAVFLKNLIQGGGRKGGTNCEKGEQKWFRENFRAVTRR